MRILNLTGHPLKFGTGIAIDPHGSLQASMLTIEGEPIMGVPTFTNIYNKPPLPAVEKGVVIVTAKMICEMFPEREDLYSVVGVVRDKETGKPIFAKGITPNPYNINNKKICG